VEPELVFEEALTMVAGRLNSATLPRVAADGEVTAATGVGVVLGAGDNVTAATVVCVAEAVL